MLSFKNVNVNPKGRKTGDCSTRALVSVTGLGYEVCLYAQYNQAVSSYYDPTSKQVIEAVLARYGWEKQKQPRKPDGSKYKVKELDQIISKEMRDKGVLVTVANHHTAVVGDEIIDIWNCGNKCVGNYYIKTGVKYF